MVEWDCYENCSKKCIRYTVEWIMANVQVTISILQAEPYYVPSLLTPITRINQKSRKIVKSKNPLLPISLLMKWQIFICVEPSETVAAGRVVKIKTISTLLTFDHISRYRNFFSEVKKNKRKSLKCQCREVRVLENIMNLAEPPQIILLPFPKIRSWTRGASGSKKFSVYLS
jgi:hypothetical protein